MTKRNKSSKPPKLPSTKEVLELGHMAGRTAGFCMGHMLGRIHMEYQELVLREKDPSEMLEQLSRIVAKTMKDNGGTKFTSQPDLRSLFTTAATGLLLYGADWPGDELASVA